MIIDNHAHALGEFTKAKELEMVLDKNNVEMIGLCPGGAKPGETPIKPKFKGNALIQNHRIVFFSNKLLRHSSKVLMNRSFGNELVYELCQKLPGRILQYFWVNIHQPDFFEELKKCYAKWHFKGLKLHQCVIPFKNDSEEIYKISEFAAENKLPIFIHIYNPCEAKKLIKTAKENPETNYIIAHMMGLEQSIKYGSTLSNLYFDTSTYYIISKKRIKKAIKYFGADHVVMGSDSPIGIDNQKNIIAKIKSLDISNEEKELVMGEAIKKLLDLKNS